MFRADASIFFVCLVNTCFAPFLNISVFAGFGPQLAGLRGLDFFICCGAVLSAGQTNAVRAGVRARYPSIPRGVVGCGPGYVKICGAGWGGPNDIVAGRAKLLRGGTGCGPGDDQYAGRATG